MVKPWTTTAWSPPCATPTNLARLTARGEAKLKEIKRELTHEEPMFWGTSPAAMRIRELVGKVRRHRRQHPHHGRERYRQGRCSPARSITVRLARGELMVPSTWEPCPRRSSRAGSSATSRGLHRRPHRPCRQVRSGRPRHALLPRRNRQPPPHLQSKLLTALQSGRIFRVEATPRSWSTSASSRLRTGTFTAW